MFIGRRIGHSAIASKNLRPVKLRVGGYVRSLSLVYKWKMASQEGFEPPTTRLEGECSIQLSYWDMQDEDVEAGEEHSK
jgi:hypothetical protein